MNNAKVNDTHNFALVGHSGDGKTSLGEAIQGILSMALRDGCPLR